MATTSTSFNFATPTSVPIIQWVFRRDGRAMTCEVDARADDTYSVSIVPHWDLPATITERFDHVLGAMERHATIAGRLRAKGWVVIDHAVPEHVGIAA